MHISPDRVHPNPYRDFELHPIDEEQVERLRLSISDTGVFRSSPARRHPEIKGDYQLAAGHHLLEAAKREGVATIEISIGDYDDAAMVAIMTNENMTQKGCSAAAIIDSVAGHARLVTYDILTAGSTLADDGPGRDAIYLSINNFSRAERKHNKGAEIATTAEIDTALSMLRTSGNMAKLVSEVHAEVEAERVERDRLEAEEREAAEARAKAAELRAKKAEEDRIKANAEAERQRKLAAEAKAKRDAAAQAAAERREAEQKARAEADAKRRIEEAAKAEAMRAEQKRVAEERAARAKREAEEKARIDAQRKLEAIYDPRCVNVFRTPTQEAAFRDAVLSDNGRRFVAKAEQLALAKLVRGDIDAVEGKRTHDVGSQAVRSYTMDRIAKIVAAQTKIDEEEKARVLSAHATARVMEKWKNVANFAARLDSALVAIRDEHDKWDKAKPFPIDAIALEKARLNAALITKLVAALTGKGAPLSPNEAPSKDGGDLRHSPLSLPSN